MNYTVKMDTRAGIVLCLYVIRVEKQKYVIL